MANANAPTSLSIVLFFGLHRIGECTDEVESTYPRARTAWRKEETAPVTPSEPKAASWRSLPRPLSTRRLRMNASLPTYPWKKFPNDLAVAPRFARSGDREVGAACPRRNRRCLTPQPLSGSERLVRNGQPYR